MACRTFLSGWLKVFFGSGGGCLGFFVVSLRGDISVAAGVVAGGFVFRVLCRGVHIRCCGHGHLGFRPYGDSLFSNAGVPAQQKVSKNACPSMGPSLRLGVPSLRHCSRGRRQPAIHGRVAASSASLPSCPLRNAYARPAGKGPEDQDQKPRCAGRLLVAAAEDCERAPALAKPGSAVGQEHWGCRFSVSCDGVPPRAFAACGSGYRVCAFCSRC
ncbi:hypothetical protein SAMN03159355_03084 [Pseudomonas sp. NFPP10]|nr:hypothetical protein SAMN03159465_03551 [Pseudomonas sp. NFPP12]SEL75033.1 hypothetical protein SAMN03159355_03084 [Pseudomonas sp. NFPP10]SFJ51363.1 hypothetical protein SAMN03159416_03500 [Pseudomonas sp. NFPP08]SFM90106.1 hypothetical protein SAMN03159476_03133 [Pseudomonas sp. NFPP05]SFX63796.1 hypothetical protein SAMN03159479_03084 [Pseudomonas sp. NFPP09]